MTGITTRQVLTVESQVNIAAIADIVQDLIQGGLAQLQDNRWLHNHRASGGLTPHEYTALEALGDRLSVEGVATLDGVKSIWW